MPPLQRFRVREKLFRILQIAGATETLFTSKDILKYLAKYIEQRQLHDKKNMRIVHCEGDALEDIFGVQEFLIDSFQEIWNFIFPYTVPATNREISQMENKQATPESSVKDDLNVVSKLEHCWMKQLPWWYFVQKHEDLEHDQEAKTATGSIMDNSTAYVKDTEYSSEYTSSIKVLSHGERFSVEFEPYTDSESDSDSDLTEPVIDESEEETIYSTPSIPVTDSSDSTLTEDYWQCSECPNMNPPTVGYCQRCWKLRKGWWKSSVPEVALVKSRSLTSNNEPPDVPLLQRWSSEPRGFDVSDGKTAKRSRSADLSQEMSPLCKRPSLTLHTETTLVPENVPTSSKHLENSSTVSQDLESQLTNSAPQTSADSASEQNTFSALPFNNKPQLPEMPGICNICRSHPNNASFIHDNVGHQYCCYKCAMKVFRCQRKCPVCRKPVDRVIRNFIYQM